MSDYNYLNARLKYLKKDLFSRSRLEEVMGLHSFEELKRFFLDSPYGASVSQALSGAEGIEGLQLGLSRHVHDRFQKILGWTAESPRRLLELVFRRYELHNIKTLLRGKNARLPEVRLQQSFIPIGGLGTEELNELAKQPTLRDALSLLANWHRPLRPVLRRGLSSLKDEPVDLTHLEVELDRYYYQGILQSLAEEPEQENAEKVKLILQIELDRTNLLTSLRVGQTLKKEELLRLLLDGGRLTKDFFVSLVGNLHFSEVSQKLETTYLAPVVKRWDRTGLTSLEHRFEGFLVTLSHQMEREDPLSIGVALSYIALQTNELRNLRTILEGNLFSLSEDKIKAEAIFV